ncbi:MAG: FtsX-like permease family protein, partial [Actinomycetales bacterium]|nr:FtsX-like permease family protein [Actinomycetales bacterium]
MSGTWKFALSAARVYRSSLVGSFVIVVLASALLAATGVLVESGSRSAIPMLTTLSTSFGGTMLMVVLLVVGSTFAAGLRQRARQFALLRAVGATRSQVRAMITAEVAVLFAAAVPVGAIPGLFLARTFVPLLESGGVVPPGFELTLSALPVLAAVALLGPTALLSARVAAREAVRTDPTQAVRASAVEKAELSPVRRVLAGVTVAFGFGAALVPFFMPGTFGAAAGSVSALLLITAAALAGPALVGGAARRIARLAPSLGGAPGALAVLNARGHSRRLTAAVVPLALLLALGTVQASLDTTMVRAARHQLTEGIVADAVVRAPAGLTTAEAAALGELDGVEAAVVTGAVPVEIKNQEVEDEPFSMGELEWEPAGLSVVPPDVAQGIDLGVTAGSLDDLARAGTVAVAADAVMGTVQRVGGSITVRDVGGTEQVLEIVAVFSRGLGFGPFFVG